MTDNPKYGDKYKLFAISALGTFMSTFEASILNVALPSISTALNTSIEAVAWVILSYSLTLISLMLVFGAWTEVRGYRFAYTFGYSFFFLGSLTCVLSPNIYVLVAGRIIQATGTAMFAAVGPALVTSVFPPEERGKGLGLTVMMVSAGFMLGPVAGGLLLSIASWHSIFIINIPIGLTGLYLTQRYYRGLKPSNPDKKVNLAASIFMSIGLVAGVYGLSQMKDHFVSDPHVWGLGLVTLACVVVFFWFERNPRTALIGTEIFRNRGFVTSIAAQQANFIAASGIMVLMPFYLERVMGFAPRQVGMFLVILPIIMFVFAPLAGRMSDKIGFRALTTTGMLVIAVGQYLLTGLSHETTSAYIAVAFVILGAGTGLFSSPNSSALMGSVTEKQRAVTSGIMATSRNMGMALGVALTTALFTYFQSRNASLGDEKLIFVASYRQVMYLSILFTVVGAGFCLVRANRVE